MSNETKIDPKFVEEFLKLGRNIVEAPTHVSSPEEINLETTEASCFINSIQLSK